MNEFAELVSIWLTIPFLYLSAFVLSHWKPYIVSFFKAHRTSMTWLGTGIFIGIVGQWFDNAWWGTAWGTRFLGHPATVWLFDNGVFSNIPFRQLAGLTSVYCHARAIYEMMNELEAESGLYESKRFHRHIAIAFSISTVAVAILYFIKSQS